jgi:hypothetical protein
LKSQADRILANDRAGRVSPFAGKPPEPAMLVNVPKLLDEAQTIVSDALAMVTPGG